MNSLTTQNHIKPLNKLLKNLPDTPGVYMMKDATGALLYIGKATSLKKRVRSYFERPHDARIDQMVHKIADIEARVTRSAIEALLLEAELIKKHLPPYNVMQKDDKTYALIAITDEIIPRVIVTRPTQKENVKLTHVYGPYTSAQLARTALKIIRRIFPYHDRTTRSGQLCFDASIDRCPGICGGRMNRSEYLHRIRNIRLFLEGKRTRLLASLKRAMKKASKRQAYEEAAEIRNQLQALEHIQDIALLKEEAFDAPTSPMHRASGLIPHRIEAYDISHQFGRSMVGSMVVFTNGKIDTDAYRHFKLRTVKGVNDIAALEEILERRLNHPEWSYPDLFLIDGGSAQLHIAKKVVARRNLMIPVAALAKGPERKRADLYCADPWVKRIPLSLLIKLREESHRFAITYHRRLQRKTFLLKNAHPR